MSDKKYPYIGEGLSSGTIVTIYGKGLAVVMDSKTWAAGNGDTEEVNEHLFKNITREYLTNTYGEVKNEPHAEFLIELAEVNGIQALNSWRENLLFCFYYNSDSNLILAFYPEESAKSGGETLITIPEPPEDWNMSHYDEQAEEFEMKQKEMVHSVSKEPDFFTPSDNQSRPPVVGCSGPFSGLAVEAGTLSSAGVSFTELDSTVRENGDNLHFGGEDKCKERCFICEGTGVVEGAHLTIDNQPRTRLVLPCRCMLEAGSKASSKGRCDNDSPKIGDTVLFEGKKWDFVAMHKHIAVLYWTNDEFVAADISKIKKIKSQEEELKQELAEQFVAAGYDWSKYVDVLTDKYNITKKPQ